MIDVANCGCPPLVGKRYNSLMGYDQPTSCPKPSGGSPAQWHDYARCLMPFHDTMNCYEIQAIIDFCQGWIDQELRDNASGVSKKTRTGNNDIITGFTMYQTEMKAKRTAAQCDNQILVDQNAIQTAASLNAAQGAQNISQSGQKPILWIVYAVLAIIAIVIVVKLAKKKKK